MPDYYIIAINPGSTSTKIAVFKNDQCIFEESLKHSTQDLAPFEKITDQLEFRKEAIWTLDSSIAFLARTPIVWMEEGFPKS